MHEIQLELNIDNFSRDDLRLQEMQKQIDSVCESMGKVRRKLFSEMSEMKKIISELQTQNIELREKLRQMSNERVEWDYRKEDCLFDIRVI